MKNPWMSLWLSAANSWAAPVRNFWAGELQRQQAAMTNVTVKEMARLWAGASLTPVPVRKKRVVRR